MAHPAPSGCVGPVVLLFKYQIIYVTLTNLYFHYDSKKQ